MPSWEIECKFQILRILLDLQIWVHAEKNTQWNITPQKIILSPIQKSREITRISGYSFSILISLLRQIFCEVVVYLPRLSRIQLTFQKKCSANLKISNLRYEITAKLSSFFSLSTCFPFMFSLLEQ